MDVPRPASELIAALDAQVGAPTLIQLPAGDTPVNIVVLVRSVNPADGDVNFRFGQSGNTDWLALSSMLREGVRQYDMNVMASVLRAVLHAGPDIDGFLRGLGLSPG